MIPVCLPTNAEVNLDRLWAIIEVEVPRMIRVVEPLVPPA
jgi:hypothetical protein